MTGFLTPDKKRQGQLAQASSLPGPIPTQLASSDEYRANPRTSVGMRIHTRRGVVASLVALSLRPAHGESVSGAAVVTVLSSNGVGAVLTELGPRFERANGHQLQIRFDTAQTLSQLIKHGTSFDATILDQPSAQQLTRSGTLTLTTDIARCGIGVAVRPGVPVPDVSSVPALKKALTNARLIGFSATGGSGIYFAQLLRRLGIADQINPKVRRPTSPVMAGMLQRGELDLIVQQISEIFSIPGAQYAGPLPASVQHDTVFTAATSTHALHPAAARALVEFLSAPAAAPVIRAKGMQLP